MPLPRLVNSVALVALAAALTSAAPAADPPPDEAARIAWGFTSESVAPHPEVRFGVLDNGMRYALMRNAVPAGGLAARFRIAAGAGDEKPGEEGYLHLIEHLIFHGSETLPEGSLPLFLSHQGLRQWDDFNAYTDYGETVFRLDLAKADAPALETAARLMREIAGRLAFTRRGVRDARTAVLDEIAGRDGLADRIAAAEADFLMPGAPAARGPVAGSRAGMRRASPERLRRLYERFYRPERATLVIVGDFDPDAAEAEIGRWFEDWRARGPGQGPAPAWTPQRRGVEARVFAGREAPTAATITSVRPVARGDSGAGRDRLYLEHLAAEMLGRRLARIAAEPGAPFAGPAASVDDHHGTARLSRIDLAIPGRDWRAALQRGAQALQRALDEGFSRAELDEQLSESRRALAITAAPRNSTALADAIIDAVHRGYVFARPADSAESTAYLAAVRLDDVNAALRTAWANPSRLIFLTHERRPPGGEAAVVAAWTGAAAR